MKRINVLRLEVDIDVENNKCGAVSMSANKEISEDNPQEIHNILTMKLPELLNLIQNDEEYGYMIDKYTVADIIALYPLMKLNKIDTYFNITDASLLEVREMRYVRVGDE